MLWFVIVFYFMCNIVYILDLMVQDGLKEIDNSIEKIRERVKYVKSFQTSKLRFTQYAIQTSFDSKKALAHDVPIRWNSTFMMLPMALYYRLVFCNLQLSDSKFSLLIIIFKLQFCQLFHTIY